MPPSFSEQPDAAEPIRAEQPPAAPTLTDRVARFASGFIGGPLGDHAVDPPRRRFWTPLRVILLTGLIAFAINWIQKYPCSAGGWVDWQQYTNACYTDIRALWGAERLNEGAVPYRDHPVEYPVLTGWFMGILGQIAYRIGSVAGTDGGPIFYHLNAIVLFVCGAAAIAILYRIREDNRRTDLPGPDPDPALVRSRPSRPWDAMMLAAAPVMLVTATVNWDLFAIALSMPFFLYWQRGRPVMAGLFLGLAVAAKFYALLFIGPLLVLALRQRRLLPALQATATAAVVWAVCNAPVAYLWPESWMRFFELNSERPVDWGTGWYVLRGLTGWERLWDSAFVNDLYLVLFALSCVGIAALGFFAGRRPAAGGALGLRGPAAPDDVMPRLAQLCFLVVAAFLLFGKVWSQQYVLWLIPLAVLARPKWGMFLVWQAAELFYFFSFYGKMLQVSAEEEGRGIAEGLFLTAAASRWIAVAIMCALVVREVLTPRLDAVRSLPSRPTTAAPAPPPREASDPAPAAAP
ncbi:glycosyltransferase 87 family protein [Glycomyces sp. TRM65418]|uniref:glycosyltransferase family 87 protein n=1 Tax=Glycomyces sp. TRM65418 TaxID=2867006 RepID=UPI001CE650E0|nr:glycosyltransferase 87 family protein [Glycomyces sp. TRM65418]MCC3764115.1 glycosyltransferase 87 family protein [Glycomyces sp. TRM65418]QZD53803.1 glycosyltransferase 87 family protein [Glycomyces sp. TRM65418]